MGSSASGIVFQPPFPPKRSFSLPLVIIATATAALLLALAVVLVFGREDRTPSAFGGGESAPIADRIFFAEAHWRSLRDGAEEAFFSGYRDGALWSIAAPESAGMPIGEWKFPEGVSEAFQKLEQRFRFSSLTFLAPISRAPEENESAIASFRLIGRSGEFWDVHATIRTDVHGAIQEERWEISPASVILETGDEQPKR
ncbi:MAG: hypothetical protein A2991_03910 [Candidatus Terrybacteria bacterium RIFCSPLOWO2_01_FULL_58_14]|uniref:Uncharacterized protein n=1 Tax=Candidatus Terrybacteria bacterium RIFCSPLOWO2_01_FULL_58_14 TaxID=1802369 RepID=A0A1G2PYU6_9BACT|nr:MAG: hypothetical protein A2991_03910 [Candidatus Terrybacteria bacterium RIFCSPLOWO2_01_FULL_58_14]